MKQRIRFRLTSFWLSVIILLTSITFPSVAVTASVSSNDTAVSDNVQSVTEVPDEESSQTAVTEQESAEHVNLYAKTQRNESGIYTMEVFDVPVKFIDEDGTVKEKSLAMKDTATGYATLQSDINCVFPKNLSEGISLTYGNTVVKMVPILADLLIKVQRNDNVVSYLTGSKTVYQYSLTYTGYKEDIVVPAYTGQTEYRFTYYTNGLCMKMVEDDLVLTDSDNNIVANFSQVIVFTADDRNNTFGHYQCEAVKENEEYIVTIVLDEEYLKDENTAYPIVIDPTLEINYDNNGSSGIEDATINSATTTSPNGTSIFVGLRSTKGIARLLVRFPDLDLSGIANSSMIVSAKYILRDLMCYSTQLPIECHVFKSEWAESTVSWTSTSPDNYYSAILDTQTVYYRNGNYILEGYTYSNVYAFDITAAVKGWKNGTYDQDAGVIFKTTNAIETGSEYISVCFASYERSSNKPKLIIEYTEPVDAAISATSITMNEGGTSQLSITSSNATSVTWHTFNTSIATISSTGLVTGVKSGTTTVYAKVTNSDGVVAYYYCTVYVTIPNGVYYIKNEYNNLYMYTPSFGNAFNSSITLADKFSSTSMYSIAQKWKITYIDAGFYSLRPLHLLTANFNKNYGAGTYYSYETDQNNVVLRSLGDADDYYDIYENAHWKIEYDSSFGGYRLRSQITVSNSTMYATASGTESGTNVIRSSHVSELSQIWSFQTVNMALSPSSLSLNNSITFFAGQNISMSSYLTSIPTNVADMRTVWSSSNDEIIKINSSTGVATVVGAGQCTITARNKSNNTVAVLTVYAFDSNNVFLLENVLDNTDYATVYAAGLTETTKVYPHGRNSESHQMWRFELQSNGYYKIYPMHTNNMVLSLGTYNSTSDFYEICIRSSSLTTDNVYWDIDHISNGNYYITSKINGTYTLSVDDTGATTYLIGKSETGTASQWCFKLYENDAYWNGAYTNYSSPYNVNYSLIETSTWDSSLIPLSKIENVANYWNDISPNVNLIYNGTSTTNNLISYVTAETPIGYDGALAMTLPKVDGVQRSPYSISVEDIQKTWDSVRIELYYNNIESANLTDDQIQILLVHEMGHALKLAHDRESDDNANNTWQLEFKATYPAIMQPRTGDNEYPFGDNYLIAMNEKINASYVTNFDKSALIAKWKGK